MTKLVGLTCVGAASMVLLAGPVVAAVTHQQNNPEITAQAAKEATINLEVTGMK